MPALVLEPWMVLTLLAANALLLLWIERRSRAKLRAAQAQLQAQIEGGSEDPLRAVAAVLPTMMWVLTPDGQPEFYNRRWHEYSGIALEQESLWRQSATRIAMVHPDDSERTREAWTKAHADKTEFLINYRIRRHDQVYRWHLGHTIPIKNAAGQVVRLLGTATDIDDQKRAEERAAEAERHLRSILNATEMAFWGTDRDGLVTVAEGQVMPRLGFDPKRLIGKKVGDLAGAPDELNERIKLALSGASFRGESRLGEAWIETHFGPVRGAAGEIVGMVGISSDITERKAAEQVRLRSEEKFARIYAYSPIALCLLEWPELRLVDVNPAWVQLFGYTKEEVIGRTSLEIGLKRDSVEQGRILEQFRALGHLRAGEALAYTKAGEARYVLNYVEHLEFGEQKYVLSSLLDVTEKRLSELRFQAAEATAQQLAASEKAALEGSRLKSEFLANMSHEIRNPINGVIGMTGLLLDTELQPEQRDYAEGIKRSGLSLLSVINDILDFSKIEAGRLDIEEIAFSLQQTVDDAVSSLFFGAKKKGLALDVEIAPTLPKYVVGDPGRVRQIATNLLSNAIKFTAQGRIVFRLKQEEPKDSRVMLRFEVEDSGIGLSPAALAKMFKPFSQADSSTTRLYGGTGLGLSICKHLVERMGGEIGVSSIEGAGSLFWFTLPLPVASHKTYLDSAAQEADILQLPTIADRPARILIAEDVAINQIIAVKLLEKLGCRADAVANGREAVAALESVPYDLVLMDCHMPVMDGYTATEQVRSRGDERLRKVPIIALTANAMRGDLEKCLAVGMNDYVTKPINARTLASVLAKWLRVAGSSDHAA